MVSLLAKIFIKEKGNPDDAATRRAYGMLCGIVGITLNLLLCLFKLIASGLTGSVSIAADAFNNLSDAGSSLITMLGFKLAGQKPDPDHPFGHGRFEYISGFIVAMMILLMGFELGKSSIQKIIDGGHVEFRLISVIILAASIAVKCYMFLYNRSIGKRINSAAMTATAVDSLSDCLSTGVVLACTVASCFTSVNLDGWCGLGVALLIFWAGIRTAKETIDPILGMSPDKEFVDSIEHLVMQDELIHGIHDLVVHNYGPGRMMISLHAEVPQDENILVIHDHIDNIEMKLSDVLGCEAVIHMDPIATEDKVTIAMHHKVEALIETIDPVLKIHDFRMVIGQTHTNLIFDAVLPFRFRMTDEEVKKEAKRLIKTIGDEYCAVIHIDHAYC